MSQSKPPHNRVLETIHAHQMSSAHECMSSDMYVDTERLDLSHAPISSPGKSNSHSTVRDASDCEQAVIVIIGGMRTLFLSFCLYFISIQGSRLLGTVPASSGKSGSTFMSDYEQHRHRASVGGQANQEPPRPARITGQANRGI
ncbi:hypothetical protein PGT21_016482 [Puccinia graminis f. sp. tritici]|uniref:Uncharacterized protein n=1 Tax=Puccinia graminis f. sp. tritici TaxID=56615 RepID=A0A5B0P818_PUCGR|nr:hypothetical protein PGT21_016482 [Puccinia graminis f. sp. tritici]